MKLFSFYFDNQNTKKHFACLHNTKLIDVKINCLTFDIYDWIYKGNWLTLISKYNSNKYLKTDWQVYRDKLNVLRTVKLIQYLSDSVDWKQIIQI